MPESAYPTSIVGRNWSITRATLHVNGNYSTLVEPDIVAAFIEAEYFAKGEKAALSLVDQFADVLHQQVNEEGKITYTLGNFANYGDGDVGSSLLTLRMMMGDPEFNPFRQKSWDTTSRYSSVIPDVVPVNDGVKILNCSGSLVDEQPGITVPREYYPSLFQVFVAQAVNGLGRTSPLQLIELISEAKRLLEHHTT